MQPNRTSACGLANIKVVDKNLSLHPNTCIHSTHQVCGKQHQHVFTSILPLMSNVNHTWTPKVPTHWISNSHPDSPGSVCRMRGLLQHPMNLSTTLIPRQTLIKPPWTSIVGLFSAASVYAETDVILWGQKLQGELLHQKPLRVSSSSGEKISYNENLETLVFGLSLVGCRKTCTHLPTTGRVGNTDVDN